MNNVPYHTQYYRDHKAELNLRNKLRKQAITASGKYKCKTCNKCFNSSWNLNHHVSLHLKKMDDEIKILNDIYVIDY